MHFLLVLIFFSLSTIVQAKSYIGLENSGVSLNEPQNSDHIHWRGRFLFGQSMLPFNANLNWQYGWEAGLLYLAPAGFGVDGLFTANNYFSDGWALFYKLGLGIEHLSRDTMLYSVGKLGFSYEFKNGVGVFISENYQAKPLGASNISYDGLYTSLGMTYHF